MHRGFTIDPDKAHVKRTVCLKLAQQYLGKACRRGVLVQEGIAIRYLTDVVAQHCRELRAVRIAEIDGHARALSVIVVVDSSGGVCNNI